MATCQYTPILSFCQYHRAVNTSHTPSIIAPKPTGIEMKYGNNGIIHKAKANNRMLTKYIKKSIK
jgi:hypothetical protein